MKYWRIKGKLNKDWFDVEDITEQLLKLVNIESQEIKTDLNEALYQLKAVANNPYNSDYYRTLYNILLMTCDN